MLTPNEDGLLPCFRCSSDAGINLGTWVGRPGGASRQVAYCCGKCRTQGPRSLDQQEALKAWNRIQRALEAFEDAERSADLEERKLQAFENLMDHPEWGPGR